MVHVGLVVDLPIRRRPLSAGVDQAGARRRDFADIAEERLSLEIELKREVVAEAAIIEADVGQEWQQGLDLGGEIEPLAHPGRVQWLDAEAVAGQQQGPFPLVPHGEGEHPAEALHASGAPFAIGVENDLGVGAGGEDVARGKLLPQLAKVVDLAVEDDCQAGLVVDHRLRPAFQIDDAEADVAQPGARGEARPNPFAVRAAVTLHGIHVAQAVLQAVNPAAGNIKYPCNSAHSCSIIFPPTRGR